MEDAKAQRKHFFFAFFAALRLGDFQATNAQAKPYAAANSANSGTGYAIPVHARTVLPETSLIANIRSARGSVLASRSPPLWSLSATCLTITRSTVSSAVPIIGLTEQQQAAGLRLKQVLEAYLSQIPDFPDPHQVINDPGWTEVRAAASEFVRAVGPRRRTIGLIWGLRSLSPN